MSNFSDVAITVCLATIFVFIAIFVIGWTLSVIFDSKPTMMSLPMPCRPPPPPPKKKATVKLVFSDETLALLESNKEISNKLTQLLQEIRNDKTT